ncbi:MAG: RNase adapter RapZ [Pseudomonadota bacterium]
MSAGSDDKRLIIVSGLSGAGKSVALHTLEDLGYYCIDNLPAGFLRAVVDDVVMAEDRPSHLLAVGIDARNRAADLEALPQLIAEFRDREITTDVLFIQASQSILLKRYSETRRRHPLAEETSRIREAIAAERGILAEVINSADLIIDTSQTSIYELADLIRKRVDRRKRESLSVLIESFGFKHGIPADADFVFDLRSLPNPYWTLELRGLTGLDPEVAEFLNAAENVQDMHDDIFRFLERWIPEWQRAGRGYLTVAVGCTGGQHRSVYMTERLAQSLRTVHTPVAIRHRSLKRFEDSAIE